MSPVSAPRLVDMHCHLDRMANADEVAREAGERGIGVLCATVTPEGFLRARGLLAGRPFVRVAAGLHPWWVCGDGGPVGDAAEASRAVLLAREQRFVGEVGLDFGPRHEGTRAAQVEAFRWIAQAVAEHRVSGRVLTIHAVRAADTVLDVLQELDLPHAAACILHRFSGTSDEFARARRLGCYFSVSEQMLATKRGREYARQAPLGRLLLETDAPPVLDTAYSADELERSLSAALAGIAAARGADVAAVGPLIAATSARLLGM